MQNEIALATIIMFQFQKKGMGPKEKWSFPGVQTENIHQDTPKPHSTAIGVHKGVFSQDAFKRQNRKGEYLNKEDVDVGERPNWNIISDNYNVPVLERRDGS